MPFSWYHPDVPQEFRNAPEKARRMYEEELGQRAALLMRLGFSKQDVVERLRGNVRWDFALHSAPAHEKRVKRVVDQVFRTRSAGGGGPPTLDD